MNKLLIKLLICLFSAAVSCYICIRTQNALTSLRREIPALTKQINALQEENQSLQYEVDRFENPLHLIELSRKAQFGHLKYPHNNEVIVIPFERETIYAN